MIPIDISIMATECLEQTSIPIWAQWIAFGFSFLSLGITIYLTFIVHSRLNVVKNTPIYIWELQNILTICDKSMLAFKSNVELVDDKLAAAAGVMSNYIALGTYDDDSDEKRSLKYLRDYLESHEREDARKAITQLRLTIKIMEQQVRNSS